MGIFTDFVKIHLPDILAFTLIAASYIISFVLKNGNKKTTLLTKDFVKEKTQEVHAEYNRQLADYKNLIEECGRITAENKALTERLNAVETSYNRLESACLIAFDKTSDPVIESDSNQTTTLQEDRK